MSRHPTDSSSVSLSELARALLGEEERILANVEARLATSGVERGTGLDYDQDLVDLRDQVAEAKTEDLGALVEQMMRVAAIAARRGRSRTLPADPMSPYFAHLRLFERGRERDVLIGKRSFIDRTGPDAVQIVDWRNAPVSQIYYRYEEGDDYDEPFEGGRLEGVVRARRNVAIVKARLRRVGTPQATYVRDARGVWHEAQGVLAPTLQGGQGTAVRPPRPGPPKKTLGIHSGPVPRPDKHLPEIAALIDRAQFDLITRPDSGLVVIEGGAGSGKTTVALHRVAYLTYADAQRFRPSRMLVVVPSLALTRYIDHVLPSLGVAGVPVVMYQAWSQSLRSRLIPGAGARYAEDTPEVVSRAKKHPVVLRLLERFVNEQAARFEEELAQAMGAQGQGVARRFAELGTLPLAPRCGKTLAWLAKQGLDAGLRLRAESVLRRLRRRAVDVVTDWEELMTHAERLRGAFAAEAPGELSDRELSQVLAWCARQRESLPEEDHTGMDPERYLPVDRQMGEAGEREPTDGTGTWDPEDDPLLLRLWQLKLGGLVEEGKGGHEHRFEHISIDEAQDLAPIDVRLLLEATTPSRCVTIAGDGAQRFVFDNGFRDFRGLLSDAGVLAATAGPLPVEVRPLKLSYRSTAEVMRFARAVLPPHCDPDTPLVARPGEPVELHSFTDAGAAVAFLAEALRSLAAREPTASVALIARHAEQADTYHAALSRADVPALRRVRRQDFAFTPGVDVTDVAQVKGLEFDYVILVEVTAANYPDTVEARHLLHIGATRAAHQLWLVTTAEPSPILPVEMRRDVV
jgi:DNA helicase-2/ATP-dependent DNA helicase PcrA